MDFLNMIKSQLQSDWRPCADIWSPAQTDATLLANSPLPALLDVTCWVRLHSLLHVVACCWELLPNVWNRENFKRRGNWRNNSQHNWELLANYVASVCQELDIGCPVYKIVRRQMFQWYKKLSILFLTKTHHLWIIVLSLDYRVGFFKEYLREREKGGFIYAWAENYLQRKSKQKRNTVGQHCAWADHYL